MAFFFVTGKLGNGKSLVSVSRIRDKLRAGLPVATNIDLNLQPMFGKMAKNIRVIRVPDKPRLFDLECIGVGNETYDESKNGLLVLDECGTWFNARNWQDKTRGDINNWFLHARKLGWDVILIVQDISIVDNQAREALSEFTAFCKRLDNIRIPIFGGFLKAISAGLIKMPKLHIARVVYGASVNDPLSDRWVYKGTDLFTAYDTKQIFISNYPHGAHSVLPPYYFNRRTYAQRNGDFFMRLTKIYFRKFKAPAAIVSGLLTGVFVSVVSLYQINANAVSDYKSMRSEIHNMQNNQVSDSPSGQTQQVNVDPLIERLGSYRIVGYSVYSDHVVYDLADINPKAQEAQDGENTNNPVITTDQLSALYDVRPSGPCHVSLVRNGAISDLYCM